MTRDTSAYVHFPWCLKKCPYCDFATRRIDAPEIPHTKYADGILRQLEAMTPALVGRRLTSIFFGGGTPSLWLPAELGRVIRGIRAAFADEAEALEITVECNPSSLERSKAAALVQQGVNRVSIGVQSLSDTHLRFLGRFHTSVEALAALKGARREVPRVSADLMFGMPGQTESELRRDVDQLVDHGITHLSAYALTIEPGTQFGELHRKKKLAIAPDDDYASMYLAGEAALVEYGFDHYEVSNYARSGHTSIHNQHYWRGGDYVGLGAGAVGCLTTAPGKATRKRNESVGERWLETESAVETEELGPDELIREGLMLGLRTDEGLRVSSVRDRAAKDPRTGREQTIRDRVTHGDLVCTDDRWWVPKDRWLRLDGIVADLF